MAQPSEGVPLQSKKRPLHSETTPGMRNVAQPALVDKAEFYLPPLHTKCGLMTIYVEAMDKESEEFVYSR